MCFYILLFKTFFFKKNFKIGWFYMYGCLLACMSMHPVMSGALGCQKKAYDSLKLELQTILNSHVSAENPTLVFCKNQWVFRTISPTLCILLWHTSFHYYFLLCLGRWTLEAEMKKGVYCFCVTITCKGQLLWSVE